MNMQIEIWSDIVCPWCYLGKRRLELALAEVDFADDVQIVHRSFQLDANAPLEPVSTLAMLTTKYGMTPERAGEMQREMEERAAADGLEYHLEGQTFGNTYAAHRLLQFAKASGRQADLLDAMYRAYFTDQESVFDEVSLTALATSVGLDASQAAAVLAGSDYTEAVEADVEQARLYGISGVPFYVFDSKLGVSGAQPVEVFVQALTQAHAAG